ncbi:hypothetical protein YPPY93_2184, partial [Yersinia pestis PY-93]
MLVGKRPRRALIDKPSNFMGSVQCGVAFVLTEINLADS